MQMNNSQEKLISVRNLNFKYNKEIILSDINFDIIKGENVAILGRNGGGKSTLIKVMLGFLKKNSGSVEFFINKNKIGYLPQIREFDASFPINIFDLVISGLASRKNLFRRFNKEEKEKTEALLKEFGIDNLKNKLISEVSGGQLQRALIARALISSPDIILSPSLSPLGANMYDLVPSSYSINAIFAVLFGSYSIPITVANISSFLLLKSIILYFFLFPPPL